MTDEHKELMEKFDEIKSVATEKKKELPNGYYDAADVHYFYALSSLFQLQRTGAYSDEDVEKHCAWLCNKYIADKAVSERNKQICSQNHKRRMCCSELLTKLIKTADTLTDSEIIDICIEIIGKGFDDVTAKEIKKKLAKRNNRIEQMIEQLTKPKVMSVRKLFELLFCKFIPAIIGEDTGRKVKEGVGYFLITGTGNLTETEKQELMKWYG